MIKLVKKIVPGFIWAIAFFTAMFIFKDLFVDPLIEQISQDKTLELAIFIFFTIIALLTGKHVPWVWDED